jgi:hypothetical protein
MITDHLLLVIHSKQLQEIVEKTDSSEMYSN